MKVLVTGVCGMIGSYFTERLLKEGHEVIGLDNLSFVTRDANQMKSYLHMDEWVKLAEVMIARHYARKELENK